VELGNTAPLLVGGETMLTRWVLARAAVWQEPILRHGRRRQYPLPGILGVPYIDTEDPRCKPRPATVPGKGSYVKVVGREGQHGTKMVESTGSWPEHLHIIGCADT
jgi:hypothetical protein